MGTIKRTFANSLTGTGKLDATNLDSNIPAANIADASVTNITTLPESFGQAISSVASDPPSPSLGDIWYNSTTGKLKNYTSVADAWSAGGNMNTGRTTGGGAGTQTAALYFAGNYDPTARGLTEEYNGSTWSEQNDMNQARVYLGATGTQTAALAAGGRNTATPGPESSNVEEYNGSSWTNVTALPTATRFGRYCGPQTAALGAGGYQGYFPGSPITTTFEYDGTNWTTGGSLNNAGEYGGIAGIQTAAIVAGLYPSSGQAEEYNGSTWSNVNPLGSARYAIGTFGTQTSAVFAGGGSGSKSNTERYDGTNWSTTTSLTTGRRLLEGGIMAPSEAGIVMAGVSNRTDTEEFTGGFEAARTVTTS